jgi:nucleolar protein 12
MNSFESIFKNNSVDPNLNAIFSRKSEVVCIKPKTKPKSYSLNKANEEIIQDFVSDDNDDEMLESDDDLEKKTNSSGRSNLFKKKSDHETEERTVFVGNLSCDCKKEELLRIFKSYGKIESVRFRNVVPEDLTKPKKFAFITKQQHPNKKTINAFVRFGSIDAATQAASEVNGMEYKSLHLRVDIANKSKVHDNRRSLFLGGLAFDINDEEVYEHFQSCGPIEYVRIIRDNKTGIGKGFGYVQFKTSDTVSLGLKMDGTLMNDRKIRVNRCVKKLKPKKEENNTASFSKGNIKTSKTGRFNNDKSEDNLNSNKKVKTKPRHRNRDNDQKHQDNQPKNMENPPKSSFAKTRIERPKDSKKKTKKKSFKKRHISTNNKNRFKFNI